MRDLDLLQLQRRIDRLIAPWNEGRTPGCTVGVVRSGALQLHRSAGLANLDLDVPIGPDTTFRVASVTKQFTCAAVLLLAADGKLHLDDDIHDHLPDLPDFGARITVDHLMHNSSGIRDFLELMRLGGMDLQQTCRRDDVMHVLRLQRGLNFAPGSRFLYSNTNFLLLGLIIETLSGESLSAFADRRIFRQLGMSRTRFVASTTETVPGLATGYFPAEGGGFVKAQHGFPLGGEGGLVSCVEDLALWDRNFVTHQIGGEALVTALTEQAPFTNGRMNAYARGLTVKPFRGLRSISHGGLWPGYRTEFLRLPDRALTVICIANLGTIVPYALARQVAEAALDAERVLHPVPPLPERDTLEHIAGRYLDPDTPATADMALSPDGGLTATINGVPFRLIADGDNRLVADASSFEFAATPTADGLIVESDAGHTARFRRVADGAELPGDIAGRYACDEVGATWIFSHGETGMQVRVAGPFVNGGPWDIEAIEGDIFRVWTPSPLYRGWLDVKVQRGTGERVTGLLVNGGRTRNHIFARLD
jgi:CubicO group peptidase (beta-lactamase class C family)